MSERQLFAVWQDNTIKGYIAMSEEARQAINAAQDDVYIGFDKLTAPDRYRDAYPDQ